MKYSTAVLTARHQATITEAGNDCKIQIFNAGYTTKLGEFSQVGALGTAALTTLTLTLPADTTGIVDGTAALMRITKADGTTMVMEGTAGTPTGDPATEPDLTLNTTSVQLGKALAMLASAIEAGNQA